MKPLQLWTYLESALLNTEWTAILARQGLSPRLEFVTVCFEYVVLTCAISLVCSARPGHLLRLHDDLHGEPLNFLTIHRHDHAHLQVPLDQNLLVLRHLALLPPAGHLCGWDGTWDIAGGAFTGGQLCARVVTIRMPGRQCNFHRDMRKLVTFMNSILNVLCTMTTCGISFFAFLTQNITVVNSPLWPAKFSLIVWRNHLNKCRGLYGVTETWAGWHC